MSWGFTKSYIFNPVADIDECVEHLSDCSHTCKNNAGGFTCGCHTGFNLNADGKQCDEDVNSKLMSFLTSEHYNYFKY